MSSHRSCSFSGIFVSLVVPRGPIDQHCCDEFHHSHTYRILARLYGRWSLWLEADAQRPGEQYSTCCNVYLHRPSRNKFLVIGCLRHSSMASQTRERRCPLFSTPDRLPQLKLVVGCLDEPG